MVQRFVIVVACVLVVVCFADLISSWKKSDQVSHVTNELFEAGSDYTDLSLTLQSFSSKVLFDSSSVDMTTSCPSSEPLSCGMIDLGHEGGFAIGNLPYHTITKTSEYVDGPVFGSSNTFYMQKDLLSSLSNLRFWRSTADGIGVGGISIDTGGCEESSSLSVVTSSKSSQTYLLSFSNVGQTRLKLPAMDLYHELIYCPMSANAVTTDMDLSCQLSWSTDQHIGLVGKPIVGVRVWYAPDSIGGFQMLYKAPRVTSARAAGASTKMLPITDYFGLWKNQGVISK
jgi:hypothetical protein